jgi:hypothetical protein
VQTVCQDKTRGIIVGIRRPLSGLKFYKMTFEIKITEEDLVVDIMTIFN